MNIVKKVDILEGVFPHRVLYYRVSDYAAFWWPLLFRFISRAGFSPFTKDHRGAGHFIELLHNFCMPLATPLAPFLKLTKELKTHREKMPFLRYFYDVFLQILRETFLFGWKFHQKYDLKFQNITI